jgi:hypothetical protein
MKHWQFVLDDGTALDVVAADFRSACITFDQYGVDPTAIQEIRSWES